MYVFYETFGHKTCTLITRTITWFTNRVEVHTPKGKPKIYKRTRVRTATLKQFRLKEGGFEYAGSKVDNSALGIRLNLGTYWPDNEDGGHGNFSEEWYPR